MSNLHPIEQATRQYIRDLTDLTGLPYEVVEKVLDGTRLLMLHQLFEKGLEDTESGEMGKKNLELVIPRVATMILMPINWRKTTEGFDGYTFRGKIHYKENFVQDCKSAYYGHHDHLLDHVKEEFSSKLVEDYKSLI